MRIKISWNDGMYGYRPAENHETNNVVEVPDEVVSLWDAIDKAVGEVQKQLRILDDQLGEMMK